MFRKVKKFILFLILVGSDVVWSEMKDPTMPFEGSFMVAKPGDKFEKGTHLQAIIISSDKKIAIINDKVVKEGDSLNDNHISKITSHSVELRGKKGEIIMTLFGPSIKESKREKDK